MEGSHKNDNDTDKNGPTWSLRHEFGIDIGHSQRSGSQVKQASKD